MIITPKHKTFDTQTKTNPTHDASRWTKQRVEAGTGDVLSSPGAAVTEAKAKASTLSPEPNNLLSGIHHAGSGKKCDIFGRHNAVQITGINHNKTMFTKQDFASTKKSFSRAKQPLVLVRRASINESIPHFLHGPEQLKSLGCNVSATLHGHEVTIFMGSETETFIVPRKILNDENFGPDALEAILGSGDDISFQERPGADKCLLAALLQSGALGVFNEKMATLIHDSVPKNMQHNAITCALFNCIGSDFLEVGQVLLNWGANPNSIRPSDDFGMLQQAVVCKDTAFIKLLLQYGADPARETDSCNSALEYSDLPDFLDMKPYLTDSDISVS